MPPTSDDLAIVVFARAPRPGSAKTRLIPLLGAEGAAALQARLTTHTLATARRAAPHRLELHGAPADDPFLQYCAARYHAELVAQVEGDLGARLAAAFEHALHLARRTIIVGTDCPALTAHHFRGAAEALTNGSDAVFVPTEDGGYALVGLTRCDARLFADIAWSTDAVMTQTRARLQALGWRWLELETLWDVDRPADFERLSSSHLLQEMHVPDPAHTPRRR
jgi:uncharacterized protein